MVFSKSFKPSIRKLTWKQVYIVILKKLSFPIFASDARKNSNDLAYALVCLKFILFLIFRQGKQSKISKYYEQQGKLLEGFNEMENMSSSLAPSEVWQISL